MTRLALPLLAASLLATVPACAPDGPEVQEDVLDFSSDQATLLVFEFDGELVTDYTQNPTRRAEQQLLYTVGHLNGDRAVGRLDKLEISDVERSVREDGKTVIRYHATLPVAWGSKTNLPTSYDLTLPRYVDQSDYRSFRETYGEACSGPHATVTDSNFWYHFRPQRCSIEGDVVFETTATVTVSDENTTSKYPEYHEVWEDDVLEVVAIFGKYERGATTADDAGIRAYNEFVATMKADFFAWGLETTPADVSSSPGVNAPDIEFRVAVSDTRTLEVTALLVDELRSAPWSFNQRYKALSRTSDVIMYNGHAGLGSNVEALSKKGDFVPDKYQMMFINGCDTFAYVDDHLTDRKAAINTDDPNGTRFLDTITTVMPSYFHSMTEASMAMMGGLIAYERPLTYDEIFADIDPVAVTVVTGEEDNVYFPGYDPDAPAPWEGFEADGTVAPGEAERFELGELPAGAYTINLAPGPDGEAGDADLYVAVGREPTFEDYDHRPYLWGTDEGVTLSLDEAEAVHVMVVGYDYAEGDSPFVLTASAVD